MMKNRLIQILNQGGLKNTKSSTQTTFRLQSDESFRSLNSNLYSNTHLGFNKRELLPVRGANFHFSSTSGKAHHHQDSRFKWNSGFVFLSVPVILSYSALVTSLDELEPNSTVGPNPLPCRVAVGAAWAAKNPRPNLPAWCKLDCGEDAFFAVQVNSNWCLGMADGVGGWNKFGVDSSHFAWEFIKYCQSFCEEQGLLGVIDPLKIATMAYDEVIKQKNVKAGSSTAVLAIIDTESALLTSYNLGDSGYVIIRDGKVAYKSQELTRFFNAPFQLTVLPPEQEHRRNALNKPSDGQIVKLQLEAGDLIILGTDGLFDNLFKEDIEKEVAATSPKNIERLLKTSNNSFSELNAFTNEVAGNLVKKARLMAKDRVRSSPFTIEGEKHGHKYPGGKMDDITVVVGLVYPKTPTDPSL